MLGSVKRGRGCQNRGLCCLVLGGLKSLLVECFYTLASRRPRRISGSAAGLMVSFASLTSRDAVLAGRGNLLRLFVAADFGTVDIRSREQREKATPKSEFKKCHGFSQSLDFFKKYLAAETLNIISGISYCNRFASPAGPDCWFLCAELKCVELTLVGLCVLS